MDERRIARIREMETALNQWVDLGNKGEELLEVMTAHLPSLERLVAYYSSPDWMRDHDASDEGLLTQLYGLCGIVKDIEQRLGKIP